MESVEGETGDEQLAKLLFQQACLWTRKLMGAEGLLHPVALQMPNNKIVHAVATKDIKKGMLVIPVFCRKEQSFVVPSCPTSRAAFQVMGNVQWTSPPEAYGGAREIRVRIACQPEARLPVF